MKTKIISMILLLILCFSISGCNAETNADLWQDAIYTRDTSLGSGRKTFTLEVVAGDRSVTFTINTDKENLQDALLDERLVEGDNGQFGLYIKKVNGITADYGVNGAFWSLCMDNTPLETGVAGVKVQGGEKYQLIYTE